MNNTKASFIPTFERCGIDKTTINSIMQLSRDSVEYIGNCVNNFPNCKIAVWKYFPHLKSTHYLDAIKFSKTDPNNFLTLMHVLEECNYDKFVEDVGFSVSFWRQNFTKREVVNLYYEAQKAMPVTCRHYIARLMECCLFGGLRTEFEHVYKQNYSINNITTEFNFIKKLIPLFSEDKLMFGVFESEVYNGYKKYVEIQEEKEKKEKSLIRKTEVDNRLDEIKEFLNGYLESKDIWSISVYYSESGKSRSEQFCDIAFLKKHDYSYYEKIHAKSKIHLNGELKDRINTAAKNINKNSDYTMLQLYRDTHINYDDMVSILHMINTDGILKDRIRTIVSKFIHRFDSTMYTINKDFIMSEFYQYKGYTLTDDDKKELIRRMDEEKLPYNYQIYRDLSRKYIMDKINKNSEKEN